MIKAIEGIYEKGSIKLLERPKLKHKVRVIVNFLIEDEDDFSGHLKASETALSFWENKVDDEVWNNA